MANINTRQGLTTQEQIDAMYNDIAIANSPRTIRKNRIKRIRNIVTSTIYAVVIAILCMILVNIYIAKNNDITPSIFGYYAFSVQTGSMDPTLPVGTVIISKKPKDATNIPNNSIITFENSDQQKVTHRIIEVTEEDGHTAYRTKGDNPINSPDIDLVKPENVEAVFLFKLPSLRG